MNNLTAPNVIANTEQVRMLDLLDTRLPKSPRYFCTLKLSPKRSDLISKI